MSSGRGKCESAPDTGSGRQERPVRRESCIADTEPVAKRQVLEQHHPFYYNLPRGGFIGNINAWGSNRGSVRGGRGLGCPVFATFTYLLPSESKQIWILFASYLHVSEYLQTPFIRIICSYLHPNIHINLHANI
jgi:hypothetical protein